MAAVGLYAWEYASGLLVLFAVSWLHVLLELPLDHRTFVGIGRELGSLVAPAPGGRRAREYERGYRRRTLAKRAAICLILPLHSILSNPSRRHIHMKACGNRLGFYVQAGVRQ